MNQPIKSFENIHNSTQFICERVPFGFDDFKDFKGFRPIPSTTKKFCKLYNGKGLNWLTLKMMGATVDVESAVDILDQAVESGFISYFSSSEREQIIPHIMKNIPILKPEDKKEIAILLLTQFEEDFKLGHKYKIHLGFVSIKKN